MAEAIKRVKRPYWEHQDIYMLYLTGAGSGWLADRYKMTVLGILKVVDRERNRLRDWEVAQTKPRRVHHRDRAGTRRPPTYRKRNNAYVHHTRGEG